MKRNALKAAEKFDAQVDAALGRYAARVRAAQSRLYVAVIEEGRYTEYSSASWQMDVLVFLNLLAAYDASANSDLDFEVRDEIDEWIEANFKCAMPLCLVFADLTESTSYRVICRKLARDGHIEGSCDGTSFCVAFDRTEAQQRAERLMHPEITWERF